MKRDMNLIRELLLFYESDCSIPYPTEDTAAADEHLIMLVEAGLLDGEVHAGTSGSPRSAWSHDGRGVPAGNVCYCVFPLTWAGHDFLAAARDQKIWNKTMSAVGGMTFEIIKEYLKTVLRQSIGMGP